MSNSKYLVANRLEDVISLISVLSLNEYTFLDGNALKEILRNNPASAVGAETWFDIGMKHPEFFRPNGAKTHLGLLLRSYKPVTTHTTITDYRETMSITETQELINKAMSLYDKQANHSLKFFPIWPSLIAALVTGFALFATNYYTIHQKDSDTKDALIQIKTTLDSINSKIRIIPNEKGHVINPILSDSMHQYGSRKSKLK